MPWVHGVLAALAFACMNFVLKHFCQEAGAGLALMVRGGVGVVLLWPVFWASRGIYLTQAGVKIWLRSLAGSVSVVCLYLNLKQVSVGDASLLANCSPIFVIALQFLFLSGGFHPRELLGTLLAIVGVTLISSPNVHALPFQVVLTGLCGALFAAIAYLTLKSASKSFRAREIVWAFCLMMLLTGILLGGEAEAYGQVRALVQGRGSGLLLLGLVAAGFLGLLAQILMTLAFRELPAIVAASLTLSMVLWGVALESLHLQSLPKPLALMSYVLVLAGLLIVQSGKTRGIPSRV